MREIFRKYLDNNCSPAEVRRLLAYFNIDKNENILRRLITEWLEENQEDEGENIWQTNFYRPLEFIKNQMNIQSVRLIALFRKIGLTVAAEASTTHLPFVFSAIQYCSTKNINTN